MHSLYAYLNAVKKKRVFGETFQEELIFDHTADDLKRIHTKFLGRFLGLNRDSCTVIHMIRFGMGQDRGNDRTTKSNKEVYSVPRRP